MGHSVMRKAANNLRESPEDTNVTQQLYDLVFVPRCADLAKS